MRAILKGLALGLLLVAVPAFAAGIDGDWAGSIDSPNGPITIAYTFVTDGNKLTGTTTGPDGTKTPLKDGKIDGANVSFSVDVDMGGTAMSLKYTGVIAADSIALTLDFQGMPVNITAKRVAAKK